MRFLRHGIAPSIVIALAILFAPLSTDLTPRAYALTPSITIQPNSGIPGTLVSYTGAGFTANGRVTALLVPGLGLIVDEKTADAQGRVSGSFVMPDPVGKAELGFGAVGVFAIDRATGTETPPVVFNLQQPRVDARIEIVFPHDTQRNVRPVSAAPLVNVAVFLFNTETLNPVPCNFPNTVTLRWSSNLVNRNGVASQVPATHDTPGVVVPGAVGTREIRSVDGKRFPAWIFNDVPVPFVQALTTFDPVRSKQFFFVEVEHANFRTNVWSHGDDPRTFFPQQFQPTTGLVPPRAPIDAMIQVVFPHDVLGNVRPVAQAPLANVALDLFNHPLDGPADAEALRTQGHTVRLLRALNDGMLVSAGPATQVFQTGPSPTGIVWPRWEFDDVDVSAAQNPINKYFFAVTIDGLSTHTTIWSHGAEARTIFPRQDVPAQSGQGC